MWAAVLQSKYRHASESDQAVVERCIDRTMHRSIG
jgi:hypothetical protein